MPHVRSAIYLLLLALALAACGAPLSATSPDDTSPAGTPTSEPTPTPPMPTPDLSDPERFPASTLATEPKCEASSAEGSETVRLKPGVDRLVKGMDLSGLEGCEFTGEWGSVSMRRVGSGGSHSTYFPIPDGSVTLPLPGDAVDTLGLLRAEQMPGLYERQLYISDGHADGAVLYLDQVLVLQRDGSLPQAEDVTLNVGGGLFHGLAYGLGESETGTIEVICHAGLAEMFHKTIEVLRRS